MVLKIHRQEIVFKWNKTPTKQEHKIETALMNLHFLNSFECSINISKIFCITAIVLYIWSKKTFWIFWKRDIYSHQCSYIISKSIHLVKMSITVPTIPIMCIQSCLQNPTVFKTIQPRLLKAKLQDICGCILLWPHISETLMQSDAPNVSSVWCGEHHVLCPNYRAEMSESSTVSSMK